MNEIPFIYPPSETLLREQIECIDNGDSFGNLLKLRNINLNKLKNANIEKSSSGYPALFVNGIAATSRHNPLQEAKRQVQDLIENSQVRHIVFFGAGLGYTIILYLQSRNIKCFWFEPNPEILSLALSVVDFRNYLDSGKLVIISEIPASEEMQQIFGNLRNKDITFFSHRATFKENSAYEAFFHQCENYLNKKDVNILTLSRFDRMWASNFIKNITHLKNGRPVQDLFHKFKGTPALICGAGPSLSDSLDDIKKYRSKYVLIAVDTSLKILFSHGIDPDITVTVDPQPVNREYLEGYTGKSLFVADPCCNYSCLRNINENKLYYFRSPFSLTEIIYPSLKEPPSSISFGGSVSTNAYDLAVQMGCSEIFLVGMDLSFTGERAHAKGAVLEEKLNFLENRIYRREMHNFKQMTALPRRKIKNIAGNFSITNDKLIIFHKWFEGRFNTDKKYDIRIYNLTSEGAEISGTQTHDFESLEGRPDAKVGPILNDISALFSELNCNPAVLSASLLQLISDLSKFLELADEGKSSAEIIYRNLSEGTSRKEMSKFFKTLDSIDGKILKQKEISSILSGMIQKALSLVDAEDPSQVITENDAVKKDIMIAKKSLYLYSELSRACRDHLKWLKHLQDVETHLQKAAGKNQIR